MVVVYVPIYPDNKSLSEQQKKFLEEMLKKGWKHLGHTKLKEKLSGHLVQYSRYVPTYYDIWKI